MPYMHALYVCTQMQFRVKACLICVPYMYALYACLYVCLICMAYMYALYVCLICMHTDASPRQSLSYMRALYVCLICMPHIHAYMYALYVCTQMQVCTRARLRRGIFLVHRQKF